MLDVKMKMKVKVGLPSIALRPDQSVTIFVSARQNLHTFWNLVLFEVAYHNSSSSTHY